MVNSRTETPLYLKSLSEADQGGGCRLKDLFLWFP